MALEEEIKESVARIEVRKGEIETQISSLDSKIKSYTAWAWGFIIAGLLVGVLGTISFAVKKDGLKLNELGDFLGGAVAALWSLAGLFIIYVAFLGQKQQLLNQQLELMFSQLEIKYTRQELEGQKKEMIEQNKTLKTQRFENTFFQMLSLFNSIANSFEYKEGPAKATVVATGRDTFLRYYNLFNNTHLNRAFIRFKQGGGNSAEIPIEVILQGYSSFYDENQSVFGTYFRTLYNIVRFIDESGIEDKKKYIRILRAQLSTYELTFLFYNCLHINGREKFKVLVERYSLLNNLDIRTLQDNKYRGQYAESAYS